MLQLHPRAEIVLLTAERSAGKAMRDVFPQFSPFELPTLVAMDGLDWAKLGLDLVFCALPHATTQQVLKELLAPHHIPLVINDRIDVALACGAQGVHLGQSDMPVVQARRLLPPDVFIGWSVETMEDVARSALLPVDYLGVSPIHATSTKSDTQAPWGLDGLQKVRAATALPLVAIGGLHVGNASSVLSAGADGVACVCARCG